MYRKERRKKGGGKRKEPRLRLAKILLVLLPKSHSIYLAPRPLAMRIRRRDGKTLVVHHGLDQINGLGRGRAPVICLLGEVEKHSTLS